MTLGLEAATLKSYFFTLRQTILLSIGLETLLTKIFLCKRILTVEIIGKLTPSTLLTKNPSVI